MTYDESMELEFWDMEQNERRAARSKAPSRKAPSRKAKGLSRKEKSAANKAAWRAGERW